MRALLLLLLSPTALADGASDSVGRPLLSPGPGGFDQDLAAWGAVLSGPGEVALAPFADRIPAEMVQALDLRVLPEALRLVPGVAHSRDMWGEHRFAARGLRAPSELALYADGLLLNDPYDGRAPGGLLVGDGELTTVRGPDLGVRRALAPLGWAEWNSAEVEGIEYRAWLGSFRDLGVASVGGARTGAFKLAYDFSVRGLEGYQRDVLEDSIAGGLRRAGKLDDGEPVGQTDDSGLRLDLGGRAGWTPFGAGGPRAELKLRGLREKRGALIGYFDTSGPGSELSWTAVLGELALTQPLGEWKIEARLTGARHMVLRHFQIAPPGYRLSPSTPELPDGIVQEIEHATQSWGGVLSAEGQPMPDNTLSAGVGLAHDRLADFAYRVNVEKGAPAPLRPPPGVALPQRRPELTRRLDPYFFVEDRWRVAGPFSLVAGVRADAPSDVAAAKERCETELIGACGNALLFAPRLAAGIDLAGISFWLRYAQDARPPTFEERTEFVGLPAALADGQPVGNPALRPVSVQLVEARAGYETASGGARARLWATGFVERFTDRIEPIDDSKRNPPYTNRDAGPVTTYGAEGGARLDLSSRSWQELGVAWSRVSDAGVDQGFDLLTDTPQMTAHLALRAPLGKWVGLGLLAEIGARRRNNSRSRLEALHHYAIPAYALVGMSLFSENEGRWDVQVSVKNALQHDLRDDPARPDRVTGLVPREGRSVGLVMRGTL